MFRAIGRTGFSRLSCILGLWLLALIPCNSIGRMPDYHAAAIHIAKHYGLDPQIFVRVINQESGFRPGVVSSSGAIGLGQLMPATAKSLGVNPYDPIDNLHGAAGYLHTLLKEYGSYPRALSAYNSGRPDAYKDPNFAKGQTYNYVRNILSGIGTGHVRGTHSIVGGAISGESTVSNNLSQINQTTKKVALARFLQQTDPGSMLLRLGVVDPNENIPALKTTTALTTSHKQVSISDPTGNIAAHAHGPLFELFWQGAGGIDAKNGKKVPQGFVAGHTDHVHVAAPEATVVQLGKLAESMGLRPTENPHFGGVHPVHVKGSYHYKNEAIDVVGTPQQMRAYAHRVASIYGIR